MTTQTELTDAEASALKALWAHGGEIDTLNIWRTVQERAEKQIPIGQVYSAMESLTSKGLVSYRIEPGGEVRNYCPKRIYKLAEKGATNE